VWASRSRLALGARLTTTVRNRNPRQLDLDGALLSAILDDGKPDTEGKHEDNGGRHAPRVNEAGRALGTLPQKSVPALGSRKSLTENRTGGAKSSGRHMHLRTGRRRTLCWETQPRTEGDRVKQVEAGDA
jgi:hypothetical protein